MQDLSAPPDTVYLRVGAVRMVLLKHVHRHSLDLGSLQAARQQALDT